MQTVMVCWFSLIININKETSEVKWNNWKYDSMIWNLTFTGVINGMVVVLKTILEKKVDEATVLLIGHYAIMPPIV